MRIFIYGGNMFNLSLSGLAYLRNIFDEKGKTFFSLNLITAHEVHDDIWIDCLVDYSKIKLVGRLKQLWSANKFLVLAFEAKYQTFKHCHYGRDTTDPTAMLHFKGELIKVH